MKVVICATIEVPEGQSLGDAASVVEDILCRADPIQVCLDGENVDVDWAVNHIKAARRQGEIL